ncbi:MAG: ABC transporter permease subunit, partial [Gaiellales bacterium]
MSIVDPATANPAEGADRLIGSQPGLLRALWQNRNGRIGMLLVGLVVLGALVHRTGLTPHPPQAQDPNAALKGVSLNHLFGTDQFGRDVFSLVLEGIGVSLEIAVIATLIAGGIGTLGGIVAGYLGGITSSAILRVSDVVFAIPAILLALAIVTALGPGIFDSALAIGVGYIPIFVRVVRAPVLALREA